MAFFIYFGCFLRLEALSLLLLEKRGGAPFHEAERNGG